LSVAINVQPSAAFSWNEVIRDQISYRGGFIKIKKDEVSLVHQSAKDDLLRETPDPNPALESFRVQKEVGNPEITRKFLDYLKYGDPKVRKVNLQDILHSSAFPFFSYAAHTLLAYTCKNPSFSEDVFGVAHAFYQENSLARES
jgi:hypothetical protein